MTQLTAKEMARKLRKSLKAGNGDQIELWGAGFWYHPQAWMVSTMLPRAHRSGVRLWGADEPCEHIFRIAGEEYEVTQ